VNDETVHSHGGGPKGQKVTSRKEKAKKREAEKKKGEEKAGGKKPLKKALVRFVWCFIRGLYAGGTLKRLKKSEWHFGWILTCRS